MSVLNPEHLFNQADKLIVAPTAGPPRHVDLRRAISAAYYAVFHAILTAAADEFITKKKRGTYLYTLVYRSIDHGKLRKICSELKDQKLSAKYAKYFSIGGIGFDIQAFSAIVVELQEKRHSADYDPTDRRRTSDAVLAIATARSAIGRFQSASPDQRKAFLTLLLFPPR